MPARPTSGLAHGTPPSTAKSTLNAPGARRNRRNARATRAGSASPSRSATAAGARSNNVTSAAGSWDATLIGVPVSILPPRSVSSAASAAVIDPDPPAATGQPQRWPAVMMPAPIAEVSG